jgi:hypothetical protein
MLLGYARVSKADGRFAAFAEENFPAGGMS